MELGEPLHRGNDPSKSVWFKWQAPFSGTFTFYAERSLIPDVVLAAYEGTAVEALTFLSRGTNRMMLPAIGGRTYHIAAAIPESAIGDIELYVPSNIWPPPAAIAVPGNLLGDPSWEGTAITDSQFWKFAGSVGGYGNTPGADGTTWAVLYEGGTIWQDIQTVPGHPHLIRFASRGWDSRIRVTWAGRELGIVTTPENAAGTWVWIEFSAVASNSTSRISFQNLVQSSVGVGVDAFSVVDVSSPPVIVQQPRSISILEGGTAVFVAGVKGTAPMAFQWYYGGTALAGQTNRILTLSPATTPDAGNYRVTITNQFGMATSVVATLTVDGSTNATILVQPRGDIVPVGSYFSFTVVAAGSPPLNYQWFRNDQLLAGATNRSLTLTNVPPTEAGAYEVRVRNFNSTVWSLPASLMLTNDSNNGGQIDFRNRFLSEGTFLQDVPIFDVDGATRLNGDRYIAQLHAGPTPESMRAVGQPTPFRAGFDAGFFVSQIVTLPNVAPGQKAFAQIRVWEIAKGTSYEEARALGGKFGRSQVIAVILNAPPAAPVPLTGLNSFSLQTGLPAFTVGSIQFVERVSGNTIIWALHGGAGFRYLVEKASRSHGDVWRPHLTLTNVTGTVTFTDTANSGTAFYRARILD